MALEKQLMNAQSPAEQEEENPDMENEQEDQAENDSSKGAELDLKIAVLLGERLLEDGGFDVIEKAAKSSSNPGQVIGQFMMQMAQQMFESMPDGMKLSPEILLAQGGWVEQISDYIQEKAHISKDIMDKAEIYIASTSQQMAQQQQQRAQQQVAGGQPQQQAPVVPQQGGMM